jgi:hypothetical protein
MKVLSANRSVSILLLVLLALGLVAVILPRTEFYREWRFEGKAKIREGKILPANINASPNQPASVAPAGPSGFSPQTRLGFNVDNEWEPSIAADRFGHVYMLYAQYTGVPGCPTCANPSQVLQISNDHGTTWGSPFVFYQQGATAGGQWDSQIVVDPVLHAKQQERYYRCQVHGLWRALVIRHRRLNEFWN